MERQTLGVLEMTEQERAVMQQALEALEYENSWHKPRNEKPYVSTLDAIAALRAALAEQALDRMAEHAREVGLDYEPVACDWPACGCRIDLGEDWKACHHLDPSPQPAPEPVGSIAPRWNTELERIQGTWAYLNDLGKKLPVDTLLYAAPPRRPLEQQTEQKPAFYGFMSADGTQVDLCFTPSAPRSDGTYATAYYTVPIQPRLLSDEEIDNVPWNGSPLQFARAVERKIRGLT